MGTSRQSYSIERAALALLAREIMRPRITGDAHVDAVPEAIRLFPQFCAEPHPHAVQAAALVRHAREMLLHGDGAGARRVLARLALSYPRYARIFALHGRRDLTRSFEVLGQHLAEATWVLGMHVPRDAWCPRLDEEPLDVGEAPGAIAEKRIEVTVDDDSYTGVFVRVTEGTTSPPAFHLEVCIDAPDPARTQVAFNVLANDRREVVAVARRWAAVGSAMVSAATDPLVLLSALEPET